MVMHRGVTLWHNDAGSFTSDSNSAKRMIHCIKCELLRTVGGLERSTGPKERKKGTKRILLHILYKITEDTDLALILHNQLIPRMSTHHLLTFPLAFMGPTDGQYSSVLLTTKETKQTFPGTVTIQGGAGT